MIHSIKICSLRNRKQLSRINCLNYFNFIKRLFILTKAQSAQSARYFRNETSILNRCIYLYRQAIKQLFKVQLSLDRLMLQGHHFSDTFSVEKANYG